MITKPLTQSPVSRQLMAMAVTVRAPIPEKARLSVVALNRDGRVVGRQIGKISEARLAQLIATARS